MKMKEWSRNMEKWEEKNRMKKVRKNRQPWKYVQ